MNVVPTGYHRSHVASLMAQAPEISSLHPSLERGVSPSLLRAMSGHPQESPATSLDIPLGVQNGGFPWNEASGDLRTWWFYVCDFGNDPEEEMQHSDAFGIPKLVSVFFLRQLSPPTWLSAGDGLETELPMLNVKWHRVFKGKHVLTIDNRWQLLDLQVLSFGALLGPAARMTSALASELNSRILTLEYRFALCPCFYSGECVGNQVLTLDREAFEQSNRRL
jgi:hypothetical protein